MYLSKSTSVNIDSCQWWPIPRLTTGGLLLRCLSKRIRMWQVSARVEFVVIAAAVPWYRANNGRHRHWLLLLLPGG